MLSDELRRRKDRIGLLLQKLSGAVVIVKVSSDTSADGDIRISLDATASLPESRVTLRVWEQFLDAEGDATLYAFKYHLLPSVAGETRSPHFRYECHPDVGDEHDDSEEESNEDDPDRNYRSPYEKHPHFHPDATAEYPLNRLHFPFHREERKKVLFALGQWIYLDLVKRYYRSTNRRFRGQALADDIRRVYP